MPINTVQLFSNASPVQQAPQTTQLNGQLLRALLSGTGNAPRTPLEALGTQAQKFAAAYIAKKQRDAEQERRDKANTDLASAISQSTAPIGAMPATAALDLNPGSTGIAQAPAAPGRPPTPQEQFSSLIGAMQGNPDLAPQAASLLTSNLTSAIDTERELAADERRIRTQGEVTQGVQSALLDQQFGHKKDLNKQEHGFNQVLKGIDFANDVALLGERATIEDRQNALAFQRDLLKMDQQDAFNEVAREHAAELGLNNDKQLIQLRNGLDSRRELNAMRAQHLLDQTADANKRVTLSTGDILYERDPNTNALVAVAQGGAPKPTALQEKVGRFMLAYPGLTEPQALAAATGQLDISTNSVGQTLLTNALNQQTTVLRGPGAQAPAVAAQAPGLAATGAPQVQQNGVVMGANSAADLTFGRPASDIGALATGPAQRAAQAVNNLYSFVPFTSGQVFPEAERAKDALGQMQREIFRAFSPDTDRVSKPLIDFVTKEFPQANDFFKDPNAARRAFWRVQHRLINQQVRNDVEMQRSDLTPKRVGALSTENSLIRDMLQKFFVTPPTPTTEEEFESLDVGSPFIAPQDGRVYLKQK